MNALRPLRDSMMSWLYHWSECPDAKNNLAEGLSFRKHKNRLTLDDIPSRPKIRFSYTAISAAVNKLQPMHMEMFQQKLKLIDEDYPFTLPGWLQLTLQIGSGLTLVMVGVALVWLCIRHRSHLAALWKFSSTLVTKLKENPDLFPHLLSVGTDFLNWQHPPTPPARPGPSGNLPLEKSPTDVGSALASSRVCSQKPPVNSRSLVPSAPHHNTLEFIIQAAQELDSQGKLRTKSYLAHLKKELKHDHIKDSPV